MRTVQLLVPGSHRWTPEERRTWQDWVKPEDVISLRVPPGTVLLWRSTMLHAVTPHRARNPRDADATDDEKRFLDLPARLFQIAHPGPRRAPVPTAARKGDGSGKPRDPPG